MVCLDTSFIIDILRGDERVRDIKGELDKGTESIAVASPTVMEMISGANLSNRQEEEKQKVYEFLSSLVILDLDRDAAIMAGTIEAGLIKKGETIDMEDIMIGAIAKKNNKVLLTKNKKHFEKIKDLRIKSY